MFLSRNDPFSWAINPWPARADFCYPSGMIPLARTIALLVCLLLFAGCDRTPPIAPLTADSVVLAFGDSITHGTGANRRESYPSRLSALLGVTVINAGVPGETTNGGVQRLSALLEEHRPQLVILCEGGNDFLRRQPVAEAKENLRQMIGEIRAGGADVVLVGVPQLGLFLSASPIYKELAEEFRLPLVEEALPDILSDRSLKSDQIHPNAAGYLKLAEEIAATIRSAAKS